MCKNYRHGKNYRAKITHMEKITEIRILTSRVQELEESLRAEMRENVRLKLKIEELEHQNQKYHRNLQRFAPGEPTVRDY